MTSREAIRWTFDAVTEIPARILGLEGYGLDVGAYADLVLLQAADPIEAVRMRATRLCRHPARRDHRANGAAQLTELSLGGRPANVDPASYAPKIADSRCRRHKLISLLFAANMRGLGACE